MVYIVHYLRGNMKRVQALWGFLIYDFACQRKFENDTLILSTLDAFVYIM